MQGLLGDHYGHQTVPWLIVEKEFEALTLQLSGDSAQLATQWYWQDENALPTCYVLQPADRQGWHCLERRLASALCVAAQKSREVWAAWPRAEALLPQIRCVLAGL